MNKKQKSLTNKGFSLVELIIVIAIMAVLVGVLAPQYLKYVHNSKVSTDIQNAQEVATAINVSVANGNAVFGAAGAIDWTKVDGLTAAPSSKFGTGASFTINGDNVNGVSTIKLTGVNNGATPAKTSYEVYPNPDNATDGANQAFTGVGLKK